MWTHHVTSLFEAAASNGVQFLPHVLHYVLPHVTHVTLAPRSSEGATSPQFPWWPSLPMVWKVGEGVSTSFTHYNIITVINNKSINGNSFRVTVNPITLFPHA